MTEDGGSGDNINKSSLCMFNPPNQFDFRKPSTWDKWIKRFERYSAVSGLNGTSDSNKVTTLIYCMGEEAEDILAASKLTEPGKEDYILVKSMFEEVFIGKRNTIFERAKFNYALQEIDEPVDAYITRLHNLPKFRHDDMKNKEYQRRNYNVRFRTRDEREFKKDEKVYIKERNAYGKVKEKVAPRSYIIQTHSGCFRRNATMLRQTQQPETNETETPSTRRSGEHGAREASEPRKEIDNNEHVKMGQKQSRYGKTIKPPRKLELKKNIKK